MNFAASTSASLIAVPLPSRSSQFAFRISLAIASKSSVKSLRTSDPLLKNEPMPSIVAGTAGHIDHGKTALVRALTGIDTDRLEEEKRRGISIDLGFAHLELAQNLRIAFVDVPGHEKFIKNMLAGVGGI